MDSTSPTPRRITYFIDYKYRSSISRIRSDRPIPSKLIAPAPTMKDTPLEPSKSARWASRIYSRTRRALGSVVCANATQANRSCYKSSINWQIICCLLENGG